MILSGIMVRYKNHIHNIKRKTIQKIFLKFLEWIIFLGLWIISFLFMWEVLQKFNTKDTSFKQYEKPITEFPTITLCTPKESDYDYYSDYNYDYENGEETKINIKISSNLFTINFTDLNEGENTKEDTNTTIILHKMETFFSGTCYKITIFTPNKILEDEILEMEYNFNSSSTIDDLSFIDLYITSKQNSDGIMYNEWKDGNELSFKIDKVIQLSKI